ncbi:MAG: acyltransferase, partial [Proteiniphilum sp.]|nr:acyltransferase [Proteiniphilum sp.]
PQGEFLYRAPEKEEVVQLVQTDPTRTENVRRWWPFFRDRRIDCYAELTRRWID